MHHQGLPGKSIHPTGSMCYHLRISPGAAKASEAKPVGVQLLRKGMCGWTQQASDAPPWACSPRSWKRGRQLMPSIWGNLPEYRGAEKEGEYTWRCKWKAFRTLPLQATLKAAARMIMWKPEPDHATSLIKTCPILPTAQTGFSTSQTETKFAKEADCLFSWRFSKNKCSLLNCNTVNIFEAWMLHWKAYLGTEWSCQLLPGSFRSWEAGKLSSDLECRLSRSGKANRVQLSDGNEQTVLRSCQQRLLCLWMTCVFFVIDFSKDDF